MYIINYSTPNKTAPKKPETIYIAMQLFILKCTLYFVYNKIKAL